LAVLLLGPAGARVDDIGPAQAQALQRQLTNWVAGLLGPSVKLPEPPPWRVSADRDHYVISWAIPGLTTPSGEPAITARIHPLDGGRWSVDSLMLPPSGSFTMDKPPVTAEFSFGHQDTNGVIDPTFASESKLHTENSNVSVKTERDGQKQEEHVDHVTSDGALTPQADGRLDVTTEETLDGWNSAYQINGGKPIALGSRTLHIRTQVNGVNRDRVASLLTATAGTISAFAPGSGEPGNDPNLPPAARAQLRLAVESLQDMLSSVRLEETLDGVRVEMAGVGGLSINRIQLGMGGESTDGRLHAWIDLAVDDVASPSLSPKFAAYLPRHLEIKPTLSGVPTTELHKLALDATDQDAADDHFAPDLAAIFSHGGVELGLEALSFDLGAAKVEGTGTITVTSPGAWHGKAHVAAAGLDELMAQAQTNPDLQSALPTLIMLRGLAKQEGDRLVWDVVSDGTATTVNGIDLKQLGGGGKSKAGPPAARRPSQTPSR
jgi:hypothetical protein